MQQFYELFVMKTNIRKYEKIRGKNKKLTMKMDC